jgi:hypothetical protein
VDGWESDVVSRSAEIYVDFAGERRRFRFALDEHKRLQEALDCGLSVVVQSLHAYAVSIRDGLKLGDVLGAGLLADIRVQHIGEVIYQGLIGGGMSPSDALRLRRSWVDSRPPLENAPLAYAIGLAALQGVEDEASAGEPMGRVDAPSPEERSGSDKMASTPSALPRASRRRKSDK